MTDVINFPSSSETIIIANGWSTELEPEGPATWVFWLLVRQGDDPYPCDHVATYASSGEAIIEALEWASESGARIEYHFQEKEASP